ncbi:MAG: hypothetical protein HOQ05_02345 [Corynebacteriales bacterium]|nr:hypothetical protein [Mycobacteriales bacterium]
MQRVLFLVSANNGLTQRAALTLRDAGYSVRTAVVDDDTSIKRAVAPGDFNLIVCPFLKARIPAEVYQKWPTIIIHPGPIGDRGPSSLDWAITESEPRWGVTALSAVEEMDAGPIWAWRTFDMPTHLMRKTAVYNGPTADAAIECIVEAVAKVAQAGFEPTPLSLATRPIKSATVRPLMKQADRAFDWAEPASTIVRRIAAGDGFPGVLTNIGQGRAFVYDARIDESSEAEPGTVLSRRHHAVRIAAGEGSVWIGYARAKHQDGGKALKLPATAVLNAPEFGLDIDELPVERTGAYRNIGYQRDGDVGYLTFDFYNGAMSTTQCNRLLRAFAYAAAQDTRVLVLRGDGPYFSNGIHLGTIEAAANPAAEGWANIKAINAVCRAIITCTNQVVIGAFTGNAGAGGVMLPLGADVLTARADTVLNPHYATMGLFGSELHTYTLPRRVGTQMARRLTTDCLPINASGARDIGLLDEVGPREQAAFDPWLAELAHEYASEHRATKIMNDKAARLTEDAEMKPLDAYEHFELGHMVQDMFEDRHGFADKRHRFIYKL